MKYLDKYAISDEKLKQQFVQWNRGEMTIERYGAFLDARAVRLANEANEYLLGLTKYLPEAYRPDLKNSERGNDSNHKGGG